MCVCIYIHTHDRTYTHTKQKCTEYGVSHVHTQDNPLVTKNVYVYGMGIQTYWYIHIYVRIHTQDRYSVCTDTNTHVCVYTRTHDRIFVTKGRVWCSVLQCVAVCRSVLQCVAVCCSVRNEEGSMLQSVAYIFMYEVWCSHIYIHTLLYMYVYGI